MLEQVSLYVNNIFVLLVLLSFFDLLYIRTSFFTFFLYMYVYVLSLDRQSINMQYFSKVSISFPEMPPWLHSTPIINLNLSHAKKDQTDPYIYIRLHNEVKGVY